MEQEKMPINAEFILRSILTKVWTFGNCGKQ